jgi:hypothetical protein
MEERPISEHPYFAKRTKTGKPFKKREKALKEIISQGLESYYVAVMYQETEKESKQCPQSK